MKRMNRAQSRWWPQTDARGVLAYLLARRKATGGFGLTPHLSASVEDTYYALRSLELLEAADRAEALANYARRLPVSATSPAKVLFQQGHLRRQSGCSLSGLEAALLIRLSRQPTLAELYWTLRAARELGGQAEERLCAAVRGAATRRPPGWRTVTDLWQVLALHQFLDLSPPQKALSWILACQNLDGGFGFLPATTSFLENTLSGLRAAVHLGAGPRWLGACGRFVLRCRSGGGGFARTSGAVPSLEATYMALACLRLLDNIESRQAAGGFEAPSQAGVAPAQETRWSATPS